MVRPKSRRAARQQAGFTYLGLLLAVALMGVGLLGASEVWTTTARHERLVEVDWIGEQFVQAIGSYYDAAPGGRQVFPTSLNDLVEDRRGLVPRRHLRKVYLNPFSGAADWEVVSAPSGGIRGIRAPKIDGVPDREYVYRPIETSTPSRQANRP